VNGGGRFLIGASGNQKEAIFSCEAKTAYREVGACDEKGNLESVRSKKLKLVDFVSKRGLPQKMKTAEGQRKERGYEVERTK